MYVKLIFSGLPVKNISIPAPQDIIQYDDAAPYSPRIMPGDIYFRWEMVCVPGKKVAMYQLKVSYDRIPELWRQF